MQTNELDERVVAYFLLHGAAGVNIDGRYRRREEFMQTFEDAVFYSTQKFPEPIGGRHSELCARLVQELIDTGCLAASHDKWSGTSYQFDLPRYRSFIKDRIEASVLCQQAIEAGPTFFEELFRTA